MKKISILLVLVMLFTFSLSAYAEAGNFSTDISKLTEKYSSYDLSNVNEVAKIFSNDAEFQKLVKEFTQEKINETIAKAVEVSKDKKNRDSENVSQYLSKLKELRAIDSNYLIITDTTIGDMLLITDFDLTGKCKANANTVLATYTTYYALGLVLYGNPITAAAYAYTGTGIFFTSKVQSGGEWDYKVVLGTNSVYHVGPINDRYYYWTGEVIGNFHYGYTGATVFPDIILLSAAGLVQIISGTSDISYWSSYFDDPLDQTYIQSGIDSYDNGWIE
jgi:hypothetical protein